MTFILILGVCIAFLVAMFTAGYDTQPKIKEDI